MATLTVQGVEDALLDICGSKGANAAQFRKELNLSLPRLYNMGMWRDLLFEEVVTTTGSSFTIPDNAESIISALVDPDGGGSNYSYPNPVYSQHHDYRIAGRNDAAGKHTLSAFGIVDDGYAPTINELPASDDFTGYQITAYPVFPNVELPAALAGRTVDVDYEVASGSKTGTLTIDDDDSADFSDTDTINVTEIRSGTVDLTADVDIVAVPRTYTTDPTLTLSGTTIKLGNVALTGTGTVITVPVTDASNVVVGDLINLTGWPASTPNTVTLNAEYRVTGVDTDNDKIYLYKGGFSGVQTWTLVDAAVNKIIHYPVQRLAIVREPNQVARYRRYRIDNRNGKTMSLRLLLKRKFRKLIDSTDVVYLSSLHAIKHALLGTTAEDNADLERANYHWSVCNTILEEQLDAHRGAAKPMISFDPSGVGAYTSNMT